MSDYSRLLRFSEKTKRLLQTIFVALLFVILRVSYLALFEHQGYVEVAKRPQKQVVYESAPRGTICDRNGITLAENRAQYNVYLNYGAFRSAISRASKRKEKIEQCAQDLAKILGSNATRLEDLIRSKASISGRAPFLIQADVTEKQYFRIKMLERKWEGLQATVEPKRFYPFGRCGGDLVGYIGVMDRGSFQAIHTRMRHLAEVMTQASLDPAYPLPQEFGSIEEVAEALRELESKAYSLNALVGKTGIEASCEESLRGQWGKSSYMIDSRGNRLALLSPQVGPAPGKKVRLAISQPLQHYAETLLQEYECTHPLGKNGALPQHQPWIKGGAILLMDPKSGEILAMASAPRPNPNDFLSKSANIHKWLEDEHHLAAIWDGEIPFENEAQEGFFLGWQHFINLILPSSAPVAKVIQSRNCLYHGWELCCMLEDLFSAFDAYGREVPRDKIIDALYASSEHIPIGRPPTLEEHQYLQKVLPLIEEKAAITKQMLTPYFASCSYNYDKLLLADLYRLLLASKPDPAWESFTYERWRDLSIALCQYEHSIEGQAFDLLNQCYHEVGKEAFNQLLAAIRPFAGLNRPVWGYYPFLRKEKETTLEKHLALSFYHKAGYSYLRPHAFRQAGVIGSIFKLVPSYEALRQKMMKSGGDLDANATLLNPLAMVDDKAKDPRSQGGWIVGYTVDGKPIPMFYRGGRIPRSEHPHVGKIDLKRALETSSNPYFSLLAGDVLEEPEDLCKAAYCLGFGEKTGVLLPGEYGGFIPQDISYNRTGLYSLAIGQHSLLGTPLQVAVMLSALANGGSILEPKILKGEDPKVRWCVFMPPSIRKILLQAMRQVVMGESGTARGVRHQFPDSLCRRVAGKTSTAEVVERMSLDGENGALMLKHVWFGSILFEDETFDRPDVVCIVYTRYGQWGRFAATPAMKMLQKYEELKRELQK